MKKPSQGESSKSSPQTTAPRLGIFWLVDGKLLIDSVPLSGSEQYGNNLNYPCSHIEVWEKWQRTGKAPAPSEYEEFPRGRATYNSKTNAFTLLADRCILKRKDLIGKIKEELRLPKRTALGTDPHYRCFRCLYRNDEED